MPASQCFIVFGRVSHWVPRPSARPQPWHGADAEMASAVSNAGGLGILTGLTQPTPEHLRKEIRRCRTMTSKPFGVNLTILPALIPADYDAYAAVIADERVTMVEVAGGSPKKYIEL